jgi:hypothetical protein
MKLVGFGCSFTYGSELVDPNVGEKHHHANTRYRNNNVWLGRLANNLGCQFDNLAEPANSNFAIAQQVSSYFLNTYDSQDKIIVCIGWTEKTRMSWFGKHWTHNNGLGFMWTHNGFVDSKTGWTGSAKEWVLNSSDQSHQMYTDNAKFIVNSICKSMNIPVIQFNALGHHKATQYSNYFIDGNSMDGMLRRAMQEDNRLNFIAKDGHPNEAGHEYFTVRLTEFVKSNIIT